MKVVQQNIDLYFRFLLESNENIKNVSIVGIGCEITVMLPIQADTNLFESPGTQVSMPYFQGLSGQI